MDDGDTIFGLWQRLSEAQRTPRTFDYSGGHGTCQAYQQRYAIFGAQFINAPQQSRETDDYLHGTYQFRGLPHLQFRNHRVTSANLQCAAPTWIVATADTPVGQL